MKRFLIHVSTYWCGMDNTFRAEAESELELDEIADQLAYDNFQSYGCEAGMSPLSVVYQRDLEYEKLMNKSNEIQG